MDGQEQVLEGMRLEGKSPPLNAFVAKYSPEGQLLWLKLGLSAENSVAFEVATDAVGNAYVWAYCTYGAFTFGETTFLARNPAGRSFYNLGLILIKYGPDGQERWTLRGGNVDVKALHVSQEGAIELQGFLRDQALIWSSEGQMYDLPTPPRESRSPAKPCRFHFDTDGHLLAVKPDFPTLGDGTAHQYVRDSLGNYYALPQPSLASDPRGISYRLHWNGETRSTLRKDLFLAKFDSLQRPLWLIQFEGEYDELPLDITLDRKGNVLISGSYRNHILLKDAFKGEIELTSDYKTLFLASFSPEGQLQWATDAGNLFKDYNGHLHLRVDRKNHLFVGGGINAPSKLGKRQIEVLGPKGWVSPSWKKPIDYHSYPDAYVGCMLLESDEVEVVKNKKFKPSQKEDAAVPSPTELPKDLAYSADTLFARPATAATVSPEQCFNFRVFPNPVSQAQPDLQAEVNLPAPASITWQLVDSNGKVLLTKTQAYPAGTIVFPFSLSGYAAGVYLLRMETGGKRVVRRVVLW